MGIDDAIVTDDLHRAGCGRMSNHFGKYRDRNYQALVCRRSRGCELGVADWERGSATGANKLRLHPVRTLSQ
jgi:hypothetical protein